jgi:cytochrome c oxidase assembly factor CtaG/ferredoxin
VDASPFGSAVLASWRIDILPAATLVLTAIIYFRGWRRLRPLHHTRLPRWRLVCFTAGLTSLWVAAASPLDVLSGLFLTAHMIQHLVLTALAPPLILLGAPVVPLLRGLPRRMVRDALGPFLASPALRRGAHRLTHPAVGLSVMTLAMWGWHVPGPYQLALQVPFWHAVEHATFFTGSLLFWSSVVRPWPFVPHWPAWSIPPTLLLADVMNTVIAATLTFSGRVLYPVYDQVPRLGGPSALDDQVMAGVVMWVPGSLAFIVPAIIVTVRLLSPAARPRPKITLTLRPFQSRTRFDLLETPLIGRFLRSRRGRYALQGTLLVVAAAVIADGFMGDQMAAMNLAGVLPWTYGRFFVIVGLLAVGNVFCMACPFMLPRELGRRLGVATRHWPRAMRSKWIAVILLALFLWANEAFGLWNSPFWTAWIVAAYFVAAFVVDSLFRGASFCKYVCPIGQFQFVSSLVSPFEVRLKEPSICATCVTHDCLRGNAQQRGCELDLYIPQKAGNMDCTFCLDCVRACPHDNVGVLATIPGSDLWSDRLRSSIGRFSRRPDLAALALVMVIGGFAAAFTMVDVAWARMPSAVVATTLVTALALGSVISTAVGRAAGSDLSRRAASLRGLACRLSLAFVPLGLAMWAGHSLFHMVTGWSALGPTLQRAAIDMGIAGLGEPVWTSLPALLRPDSILSLQLLLLDAGLLLTLYAGWRIRRAGPARSGATVGLQLSWACLALVLYASGVWTFLQPMQIRGMVH